ncbi:uncharacterized protein [Aegilops tauschii subsp. strangulata]|uniref:uncharacterized protein n=1 Tax=Aegilops tauschii subsp. strangulata TaxID=200361 RepID=UPI003CC84397
MVVDELDVVMSEETPGSAGALEEQLNIQDAVSEASNAGLIAESEGVAAVVEESDASDYSKAVDELDVGASEAAPGSSNGEEISEDLDTPSQPAEQREQDVESGEPENNHGSGKEGQEPYLGLESDSSVSIARLPGQNLKACSSSRCCHYRGYSFSRHCCPLHEEMARSA